MYLEHLQEILGLYWTFTPAENALPENIIMLAKALEAYNEQRDYIDWKYNE